MFLIGNSSSFDHKYFYRKTILYSKRIGHFERIQQLRKVLLRVGQCRKRHQVHLPVVPRDHRLVFPVDERQHGPVPHFRSEDPVECRRRPSALHVAEYCLSDRSVVLAVVVAEVAVERSDAGHPAGGDEAEALRLAELRGLVDDIRNILEAGFVVGGVLGSKTNLTARNNGGSKCKRAVFAAFNFNEETAIFGGVAATNVVDALHNIVDSRVDTK